MESIWANVRCQPVDFTAKRMCPGTQQSHLRLIHEMWDCWVNVWRAHTQLAGLAELSENPEGTHSSEKLK